MNSIYEFRMKDEENDIEIYHKFPIDESESGCMYDIYEAFINFLKAAGYSYVSDKIIFVEPEDMDKKICDIIKENER